MVLMRHRFSLARLARWRFCFGFLRCFFSICMIDIYTVERDCYRYKRGKHLQLSKRNVDFVPFSCLGFLGHFFGKPVPHAS